MFRKYIKDNALEDMKVELSKMKSEIEKIKKKNEEIYQYHDTHNNYDRVKELKDTHDLTRDVLMFERFIELSESKIA